MGDFYGHAVVNGILRYASVSAVKLFDRNTKGGCPRRYHYRYVQGKHEVDSEASATAKAKGIALDGQLKNYLRTGDKSMPALALKGLHILEAPGPDLWTDLKLHKTSYTRNGQPFAALPEGERYPHDVETFVSSPLTAAGVPFVGEIDIAHARGHFRNDDGEYEDDPPDTVEVGDIKFKTNAFDRQKNSTFMHEADLVRDIQMAGYGEWFRRVRPQTKNVRLSLLYYPEKGALPTKVTRLHVIQDVQPTWAYVEGVVANMKLVAAEPNVENVPYEASSCDLWQGCGHREYCTAYERTSLDSLYNKVATDYLKEPDVGLLASNPQIMNPQAQPMPAPQAQPPQPDMRAQLAAEEAQMRQQVAAAARPSLLEAWQRICDLATATGRNGFPALGSKAAYEMGTARGYQMNNNSGFAGAGTLASVQLMTVDNIYQLLNELETEYAAQAQPTPTTALPPVAQTPPVAQPAQQPTFTQQVAQAYTQQTGGGGGGQGAVVVMSQQPPMAVVTNQPVSFLPPGAPQSMPQLAVQQPAPQAQVPIGPPPTEEKASRGRPRKPKTQDAAPGTVATDAVPVATPSSSGAPVSPAAPVQQSAPEPTSTGHASCGGIILINARIEGRNTKSLAGYVDYLNEKLARMYNTTTDGKPGPLDVRAAVDGSILGYGGWKGLVREVVKADPPADGDYHFDTFMNELNEVVADGLRVVAEQKGWMYVRGVRG